MSDSKINVLFVCDDNSIRSIIAEALLNRFSADRFHVFSCGHNPAREIHPRTVEMLNRNGLKLRDPRPRSLSEFVCDGAPEMDLIINLSDQPLPRMPGSPVVATWRITHPILRAKDAADEVIAFRRTFRELENRIRLISLLRYETGKKRRAKEPQLPQAA